MPTLFTRIINGELPGRFIHADETAVAFLSIAPLNPGHTLVVPRAEVDQWTDADPDLMHHLTDVAHTIGKAAKEAFGAPRSGLIIAGMEVPHLHVHVFPVWSEGDFNFARAKQATDEELDAAAGKLRAALKNA
ncbi:MAG: HIT family protein [Streptosporangiales bacterium]|nr:HIT family protein [Streptosporangiales bacterium]